MRILIVDDHQLFIDGIRYIINSLDDSVDFIEANSADDAIQYLNQGINPDLMLLDLQLPGMNGISIMQHHWVRQSCLPIVIISREDDLPTIKRVIDAGVRGFIPKSYTANKLLDALRTIMDGEIYIPETIRNQINQLAIDGHHQQTSNDSVNDNSITRRQHEILELLARGYSNKQISNMLCLSEHTVKSHISSLLRAFNASNRTECVSIARRQGLIH